MAVLPVLAVLVLNYVFTEHVMRRWDAEYFADAKYGSTDLDKVRGIWELAALLLSIVGSFDVCHVWATAVGR